MFCMAIADIPYRGTILLIREGIMGKCHVFVRVTPAQAAVLKAFLKKPPGERARRRAQAIWFSSQGQSVQKIAKLLSVSERSVRSWFAAWRKQGPDGLRDKIIPGRPSCLSHEKAAEMVEVRRYLERHPGVFEFHFLPTYSPWLNPMETVWREMKQAVCRNHFHGTLANLKRAVRRYFARHAAHEGALRAAA